MVFDAMAGRDSSYNEKMYDTHAHLYFDAFDHDRDQLIQRCREKLDGLINVGIDFQTSRLAVELAQTHDFMYAAIGIHPGEVTVGCDLAKLQQDINRLSVMVIDQRVASSAELKVHPTRQLNNQVSLDQVVAWGEIGLDYHYSRSAEVKLHQKMVFERQIEVALNLRLPLIVHSRDAFEDTVSILNEYQRVEGFRGVWHSFAGSFDEMEQILNLGLLVGINGIVTFPNAKVLQEAVVNAPLEKLLLETDAPFLAPQISRGQRNEPWMVWEVARKVADLKGMDVDEIVAETDQNVAALFNIAVDSQV